MKFPIALLSVCLVASSALADNPIIAGQGVCDPHIHVYNGKAYLFADHDYAATNKWYNMRDWWVWSSPDLVNWTKEFTLLPENTYAGKTNQCWATDGASRNGKYYFYFSRSSKDAGVAVSTNGPGGPYVDALRKPLGPHDPTVFIDDDAAKTSYYIGAKYPYQIAKMNDDMMSLAEKPRFITYTTNAPNTWRGTDGNFIHKHNGLYYLNQHSSKYGTSTNVYGPYTYRGFYGSPKEDHGTFFNWNNQTFNAFGLADANTHYRKIHITYVGYKENGDIVADPFIATNALGVGQYDAAWNPIQAAWYFAASDGITKQECPQTTSSSITNAFELCNLTDGSWLSYPKVRNMKLNATISFHVSSANPTGATIEIHQDSTNGPLVGSCVVPSTVSWTNYQTISTKLTNTAGTNNLSFVFKGTGEDLLRFDWFKF